MPYDRSKTYHYQIFKIPNDWVSIKRHLVRVETIMTEQTSLFIHHYLMYECPPSEFDTYLQNNTIPEPGRCTDKSHQAKPWIEVQKICQTASFVWAVGGDLQTDFPPNMAYPIGGSPTEFRYFYLQMHYENPNIYKSRVDLCCVH